MSDTPSGWLDFLNGVNFNEVEVGEFRVPTDDEVDPRLGLWNDVAETDDE